ncbi:unnamed protein product [Phytomonas sp. Hart1]|nr:unnamed protein product [Phytomonas sp. Hart1]|eukprot:CCW72043.1 unnamed protein product [Phytomonas sp. isolate Hart1]
MFIKDSYPFKKTLHLPTRDFRRLLSSPFQIKASIENVSGVCPKVSYMVIDVPLFSSIFGIELRSIGLQPCNNFNGYLTVFLQHLDGKGRPTSEKFALYSVKDNIISNYHLKIPLQGGEKVQLLFVCDNDIHKNITRTIFISGVCMLMPGRAQLSKNDANKLSKWISNNWAFQAKEDFPIHVNECKSDDLISKSRKRERSSSNEPPQLSYAFVAGGDDES